MRCLADPVLAAALDEVSELLSYLRVWGIAEPMVSVTFDGLMAPSDDYFSGTFFQVNRSYNGTLRRIAVYDLFFCSNCYHLS